ncbi:ABC transporter ATP-binding protein [Clostridia bacterium]|nr:ABC transporter ATP-binding protein [Clostridia bacterium]
MAEKKKGGTIEALNVKHTFQLGKLDVPVLHGVNFTVQPGDFSALCGASGSGKSTLLNLIGGLTKPTEGKILIDGQDITLMDENHLCLFRREKIGFIFQSYNLMPYLTALENVELSLIFGEEPKNRRKKLAEEMLAKVGLADRMNHKPNELSGGQQQRVSVARALVTKPKVVLADEPTGNLDRQTGLEIMELLRGLNREEESSFLIVTHDPKVAENCDHTIFLEDGLVVEKWRDHHAY